MRCLGATLLGAESTFVFDLTLRGGGGGAANLECPHCSNNARTEQLARPLELNP
jgi:hypothetical protein